MNKPRFLTIIFCIISMVCSINATQPNVVLIICDDLNDYIEPLKGHPQIKTPNINRLASNGVTFLEAHCNIPICNPSRASFMTGIYPHTSQCYGFDNWDEHEILKNSRTVMDHFRMHGYYTLGTGKLMHNRDRNQWMDYGYQADYGPMANNGKKNVAHPDVPSPFRDSFEAIDGSFGPLMNLSGRISPTTGEQYIWKTGNWAKQRELKYISEENRDKTGDELNGDWAVKNLKILANQKDNIPFFMGVGFLRPHTPLIVPQKYFDRYPLETVELPLILEGDVKDTFKHTISSNQDDRGSDRGSKMYDDLIASYDGNKELALKKFVQAYLASVASIDDQVGRILDVIENSSLKDNTIIIFTSDHGWGNGEKDYVYKNSLWQESTKVPLIISDPNISMKNSFSDTPVSLIDLYPTLIDLCNLSVETKKNNLGRNLEGFSLVPLLKNPYEGKWNGPSSVLTALYKWSDHYDPRDQSYSLRSKKWRYIRYHNGKEELYDVINDPKEWNNLVFNKKFESVLTNYRNELDNRLPASIPRPAPSKESAEAWKDSYFKKFPKADVNGDGILTWYELKQHKGD